MRTDLADPAVRAALAARLGERYAGRPVVLGPGTLAGWTPWVARLRRLGCRVVVVSTGPGVGDPPPAGSCTVVEVEAPPTRWTTDGLRLHDRLVRTLPASARAAIDAVDPDRRGCWVTSPFVTTDEPIDGRPVTGGRPASYLALEDKSRADAVWFAAGVPHSPSRLLPVDDEAGLADATAELAGPLGTVWSGDGFSGGGDYVRWVRDADDQRTARAFFAQHCTRVRVLPFLDGVPCSIHGLVLPDGTAAFRPVEIAVLRDPAAQAFVYGGLATHWDPPANDRERMRDLVRRVGAHLAAAHGYRGAFGVDGVLTADGFRPTELNSRMSAGLTLLARADPDLFALLQPALVDGVATGLGVADVETLLPLLDAQRHSHAVDLDPGSFVPVDVPAPGPGGRLADVLAALRPDLAAAPDVRRGAVP
ncbi:hypothetical protein [Nocardioides lianchengensis]|uniref:Uncharacterized protein n=1 Tax=Nocardioides lianchengensis TaxID=1045774 RepID=A0A1G6QTV4_9ACTN|nr:hypothetical protein [Nocardioides lianchengensis]NYG10514.1 hypothetical protein [Nocardioides lianchengensis]SDC95127.1 hypothetical protein SAMN05421872_1054 [Nocardioides lianchengensis]